MCVCLKCAGDFVSICADVCVSRGWLICRRRASSVPNFAEMLNIIRSISKVFHFIYFVRRGIVRLDKVNVSDLILLKILKKEAFKTGCINNSSFCFYYLNYHFLILGLVQTYF